MNTWQCPDCLWPAQQQACPWCTWVQQTERRKGQPLAVLLQEQPWALARSYERCARKRLEGR